jgi:periplasmic protein TonB
MPDSLQAPPLTGREAAVRVPRWGRPRSGNWAAWGLGSGAIHAALLGSLLLMVRPYAVPVSSLRVRLVQDATPITLPSPPPPRRPQTAQRSRVAPKSPRQTPASKAVEPTASIPASPPIPAESLAVPSAHVEAVLPQPTAAPPAARSDPTRETVSPSRSATPDGTAGGGAASNVESAAGWGNPAETPSEGARKGFFVSAESTGGGGIGPGTGGTVGRGAASGTGIGGSGAGAAGAGRGGLIASRGGEGSGASSADLLRLIRQRIEQAKVYPDAARQVGHQGTVELRFRIGKDGAPTAIEILRSSGVPLLDAASEETIRRAAPYPVVSGWIRLPLSYRLE